MVKLQIDELFLHSFIPERKKELSDANKSALLHFDTISRLIDGKYYLEAIDEALSRLKIKSSSYLLDQYICGYTFYALSSIEYEDWKGAGKPTGFNNSIGVNSEQELGYWQWKNNMRKWALDSFTKAVSSIPSNRAARRKETVFHYYLGQLYHQIGDYEKALSSYNKVIQPGKIPKNNAIDFSMARLYKDLGHYDKSKKYLTDILANPDSTNDWKCRSKILYGQLLIDHESNYEEGQKELHEALQFASYAEKGECYFILGESYRKKPIDIDDATKQFLTAIDYYEKALGAPACPDEPKYHRACAKCWARLYALSKYAEDKYLDKLKHEYEEAIAGFEDNPTLKHHTEEELRQYTVKKSTHGVLGYKLATSVMDDPRMLGLEENVYRNKNEQKSFLREKYRIELTDPPQFYVLQHWNSYSPIIPDSTSGSKGGGYYIHTGISGVVVDPGFDFIKNYNDAGFIFKDIDYVVVSHAHNDHTSDLESILTLLDKYNAGIKGEKYSNEASNSIFSNSIKAYPYLPENAIEKICENDFNVSKRRKRLKIILTLSTYKKYANILDINKSADYDIIIASKEQGEIKIDDNLSIKAIAAKHFDLLSDKECVGFLFSFPKYCLVYTGDTGFSNEEIQKQYVSIADSFASEDEEYSKFCYEKVVLLLAHIGGFKQNEHYRYGIADSTAYYPNHLGRLGLANIAQILNPDICIVSEFGDELMGTRGSLCKLYEDHSKKRFIPADVGLCLRLGDTLEAGVKKNDSSGSLQPKDLNYIKFKSLLYEEKGMYIVYRAKP